MTRFGVRYFIEPTPSGQGRKIRRANFLNALLEYIEITYSAEEMSIIYKSLTNYMNVRRDLGDTIATAPLDIVCKLNCNKLSPEKAADFLAFSMSISDLDSTLELFVNCLKPTKQK